MLSAHKTKEHGGVLSLKDWETLERRTRERALLAKTSERAAWLIITSAGSGDLLCN